MKESWGKCSHELKFTEASVPSLLDCTDSGREVLGREVEEYVRQ